MKTGSHYKTNISQTNALPYSNKNLFNLHNPQDAELERSDSGMGSYLPDLQTCIQGMYTLIGNAAHLLFYCIKPVATSICGHACTVVTHAPCTCV
jgi:hypothetical protein